MLWLMMLAMLDHPVGEIIPRVVCLATEDAGKQYALYLPKGYDPEVARFPVLFLIEPGGRATLPLERFSAAADEHGVILACSWDARNYIPYEESWAGIAATWNDVVQRFAVDPALIFTGGFSGGARLAFIAARASETTAGVIACGAGTNEREQAIPALAFPVVMVSGDADMNYAELVDLEAILTNKGTVTRRLVFEGPHRWPDPDMCETALAWLLVRAHRNGRTMREPAWIEAVFSRELQLLETIDDPLARQRWLSRLVTDFEGLCDTTGIARDLAALEREPRFRKALRQSKRAGQQERRRRGELGRALLAGEQGGAGLDPTAKAYWSKQIASLSHEIENGDPNQQRAARRLREFLRAACFERPIGALHGARWNAAITYAELGQLLAPEIGAFHYLEACARAGRGDDAEAMAALARAADLGNTASQTIGHAELLARLSDREGFDTLMARLDLPRP